VHAVHGKVGRERRRDFTFGSFAIEARPGRFARARGDLWILALGGEERQVDRDPDRDEVAIIGLAPAIGGIDRPVGPLRGAGEARNGVGSDIRAS
jgi:hypothetical protein